VASVFGYSDTGTDPNDVTGFMDVSSTTRTVAAAKNGRRYLLVGFRTFESLDINYYFEVTVRLDTRGGPKGDLTMVMGSFDMSGSTCHLASGYRDFGFRWHDSVGSCSIPLRLADPTKPIRWKLITTLGPGSPDFAPNVGWYA
jgi:hypothetical protein